MTTASAVLVAYRSCEDLARGLPALIGDPDVGDIVVVDNSSDRATAELVALFADADIHMAAENELEDLLEHPHLQSVGFWQSLQHPTEGMLRTAANPIKLQRTPASIRRLAPRLGEHTREVLREFEFRGDEVEQLLGEGVARQWSAEPAV